LTGTAGFADCRSGLRLERHGGGCAQDRKRQAGGEAVERNSPAGRVGTHGNTSAGEESSTGESMEAVRGRGCDARHKGKYPAFAATCAAKAGYLGGADKLVPNFK